MFGRRKNSYSLYKPGRKRKDKLIRLVIFFGALIVAYEVITAFVITSVAVTNSSMQPELEKGDRLLVLKLAYEQEIPGSRFKIPGFSTPQRGDLAFYVPDFRQKLPWYLVPLNTAVRFFTFQQKSIKINNECTNQFYIKRILGLPGETVRLKNNTVHIKPAGGDRFLTEYELTDNKYDTLMINLPENWNIDSNPFSADIPEKKLENTSYFLVTDNRYLYLDSRSTGSVSPESIRGRVFLRYWPIKRINVY